MRSMEMEMTAVPALMVGSLHSFASIAPTQTHTDTDPHTHTDTDTDRHTGTDRHRHRHRPTHPCTHRHTQTQTQTHPPMHTQTHRHTQAQTHACKCVGAWFDKILLPHASCLVFCPGRLTSAWNWCSKLEKNPFYRVYMMAGFQGFDGSFLN